MTASGMETKAELSHPSLRVPTPVELVAMLADARERTLALVEDLRDEQLRVPKIDILNPPLWEIGHVAWFQEKWNLRREGAPSIQPGADALFDSATVAHDTRWTLNLPARAGVLRYLEAVLERTSERLLGRKVTSEDLYFAQLCVFHEDMHAEALLYLRQTLAYPRPSFLSEPALPAGPLPGDVELPGGAFILGATPGETFLFDNEKWAHAVEVAPFRIARAAVTQGEFEEFVEADGYAREELWDAQGRNWRDEAGSTHPLMWRREGRGRWLRRCFDQWLPLDRHAAMVHVSWHEAQAYCRFAKRRLPTELEWEVAASAVPESGGFAHRRRTFPWGEEPPTAAHAHLGARSASPADVGAHAAGDSAFGCRQMLGNVWEWTASDFLPYPGFAPDPYREYSEPWFGSHKVLRGGSFMTQPRLLRNTWRNFYTPDRRDVWAGFRTCARS